MQAQPAAANSRKSAAHRAVRFAVSVAVLSYSGPGLRLNVLRWCRSWPCALRQRLAQPGTRRTWPGSGAVAAVVTRPLVLLGSKGR